MSTSSVLTTSELDLLLSLDASELEAFLKPAPKEIAASILAQMDQRLTSRTADLTAVPIRPTVRQADFLNLQCREALYGGAAGGGKSEALLLWLAEGIGISNYSGIIFRRTEDDLKNSNDSLISKAMRMYGPLGAVMTDSGKRWRFPSSAMIELAGLHQESSVMKHQGPSYHRVAFDELTHFSQAQYEFLVLTRIRSAPGFPIRLGARSASNPGGPGHAWVKERFITKEALEALAGLSSEETCPPGLVFETPKGHAFVPARLADNPYIDRDEYRARMSDVTDPVMRERMLNGDWSIMPNCLIKPEWLRFCYTMQGDYIRFHDFEGKQFHLVHQQNCRRVITVDTRGTSKEITRESKGKPPSWTVAQVWDQARGPLGQTFLVLRHVWRARCTFNETVAKLLELNQQWRPVITRVENRSMGDSLWDSLRGRMPIDTIEPIGGKAERATRLLIMLESGQVFLPRDEGSWKPILEAEWLSWQGLEDETNDQVDAAAYAAIECGGGLRGVVSLAVSPRGAGLAGVGLGRG